MVSYKKAISPVVATALLLVVAVVAVVGFQSWFTTYQSGINVKVEQQSNAGSALTVERLEGTTTGTVYIKNVAAEPVLISEVKIVQKGSNICNNSVPFNATKETVTQTTVTSCSMSTNQAYDVVLVSESGVFTFTQIAR